MAYRYAEGAYTRLSGKKVTTVDIYTNIVAEASEVWTREFLEDATWNVMETMTEKVGRALGEAETNRILSMYGAIANADLAGGAPIDNGGQALNWSGVVKLHNAVRGENWRPTVLALNEVQVKASIQPHNPLAFSLLFWRFHPAVGLVFAGSPPAIPAFAWLLLWLKAG